MKDNYELCLSGRNCIFVPYRPEHVPKYHEWMQDPTLLDATASEPLTMDDEIRMQGTWRDDDTKCTFIILARDLVLPTSSSSAYGQADDHTDSSSVGALLSDHVVDAWISIPPPPTRQPIDATSSNAEKKAYPRIVEQTLHAMIGDINLFLSEEENDNEEEEEEGRDKSENNDNKVDASSLIAPLSSQVRSCSLFFNSNRFSQAELDIMIASPCHRNKKLGTEASLMMMHYGASQLHVRRFFVKVKDTNLSSLHLFREKLGFFQVAYVECFGEYELECKCDTWEEMVDWVERRWREVDKYQSSFCCRRSGENGFGSECDNGGGDDDEIHCKIYDVRNCPLSY